MGQKSLWFEQQLHPQHTAYNTGFAMKIQDRMDPAAMLAALEKVYARHPLLTAVFRMGEEGPVCMPLLSVPYLEQIDARGWTDEALHARIMEKYQLPFDLVNGPVARSYVFTKNDTEHIFLFSVHHIVYDFGCKRLLSKELITFYMEACGYPPATPLPAPRQFREHALEEQALLKSGKGERLRKFWQEQVRALPLMPALAAYKPYADDHPEKNDLVFFAIEGELYSSLKAKAQQQNVTTFSWLLAAFQLLLHKYTSNRRVVLGVPVSNREGKDQDTLGYFVNLLPVSGSLEGKSSFVDYLQASMSAFFSALAHKQFPFAGITELSHTERDTEKNPLAQIAFNYLIQAESMDESLQSLISYYGIPQETAFDITFDIEDYEQNLYIACTYKTNLYDRAFMESLCSHYRYYLEQTLHNPRIALDSFQWVLPEERALQRQWNATQRATTRDVITDVFAGMVRLHAQRPAITAPDRTFNYHGLDEYSNRLAHFILQQSQPKGAVIGLMTQRSSHMVAAMLGILKAGAAYMPIDTDYPPARIQLMLEETGCTLLLCEDEVPVLLQHLLPEKVSCRSLKKEAAAIANLPAEAPRMALQGDDLAYVMFTSGSTGKPKAVMIKHAGVVNLAKGNHCMQFTEKDIFMLTSNYVFDGSTFEIYGALLNGGSLHILTTDTIFSAPAFISYIKEHRINSTCLPTALFNRLIDHDPTFVEGFDHLLFGGEAASLPHVRKALAHCARKDMLINAYGPTECTVFVLCHPVNELPERATAIPIGKPHANTQVYILDEKLRPVPAGVSGELYVSGRGMSKGYLNHPDMTVAKFIPAPWDPGELLYATGDFACRLPDGNVHFLGRKDQQIKFRGYRIEPGEIEAALCRHEKVRGAIVHCRADNNGNGVLTAFIATGNHEGDMLELQHFLSRSLPHYMIPARFHFVPEFPLNQSGKVDRKALYSLMQQHTPAYYVAPQTVVQKEVAAIWRKILERTAIGIHENFFELGGHSLLATRIISQITAHFNIELPLSAIFREPTIAAISNVIEERQQQGTESAVQPLALMKANRDKFRRNSTNNV